VLTQDLRCRRVNYWMLKNTASGGLDTREVYLANMPRPVLQRETNDTSRKRMPLIE
jgi:hypothetical protein